MDKNSIIVVTGAAGFIGSCLVSYLNNNGYEQLLLVDDFSHVEKDRNLDGKKFLEKIERETFFSWLDGYTENISFIFHLGARTDTTEFDYSVHQHLNVEYSRKIWAYCTAKNIPLVYASSAATYGSGELGYEDDHTIIDKLKPLNPYGVSKNEFDKWAVNEKEQPPFWAGLKFFNVYGPNEYHKKRMASVIFHSYGQILSTGSVKLFRSHKEGFKDGEQLRDFIYVKDILKVCYWLMDQHKQASIPSGLYNLGTGIARSFYDLAASTFRGMGKDPAIQFIDMPEDLRETYQYFTEAKMNKLRNAGYSSAFYSLEAGVEDYVKNYLLEDRII